MAEIFALSFGEAEDKAFFSTTTQSNGPTSAYAYLATSGNGTVITPGNSANGGALTYTTLLAILSAARKAKARGPFCWFCSPSTLYERITGILDQNSRPIFDPNTVVQRLFGWPIFDTTWIGEDQSVGSSSNCTFIMLANPKYIMVAEPGSLEVAVSTEFLFDKNQVAIRGVHRMDFGYAPPKGIVICKGVA